MTKYGIKVSLEKQNVQTIVNKDQAFLSDNTSFKIKKTSLNSSAGSTTIALHGEFDPPNANTINVAHGLPYQPSFLVWCQDENLDWHFQNSMSYGIKTGGPSTDVHATYCRTDLTNLIIQIINLSTTNNYTVGYHYLIMEDEA